MSLTVLQRLGQPQTHSSAMTEFVIRQEGNAVLDTACRLEYGVTVTNQTTGFEFDFARRSGAYSVIRSIEVLSEGGTSLYRLDRANMLAAVQNMRADISKIADMNDILNCAQVGTLMQADGKFDWYRKSARQSGFTSSAATTRRVIIDLRLIVSMFRQLWPLNESSDLRVRILWEDNANVWEGAGYASYAITEPLLCYQLLNLGDKLPKQLRGKQTISFLQPTFAAQRIPAVANGSSQRLSVPLGYSSETIGSLLVGLVGDGFLPKGSQQTVKDSADFTVDGNAAAGQKDIVLDDVTGISAGDRVYGIGATSGDDIDSIDVGAKTLTMTTNLAAPVADGATIQIMVDTAVEELIEFNVRAIAAAGQAVISVDDVGGLRVGDGVYVKAASLPKDAEIESIDASARTITLNSNILADLAANSKFYTPASGYAPQTVRNFRSDTQKDALVNLKIDGVTEYPSMQNVGDQLQMLTENYGRMAFPTTAYGNATADLCYGQAIRDCVGYMGFDISRRIADDIEFELQRVGGNGFQKAALGVYAWGECMRSLLVNGGTVVRLA